MPPSRPKTKLGRKMTCSTGAACTVCSIAHFARKYGVSEDEIRSAQRTMIEATRNLVEAAGAAPLAAALKLRDQLAGKRIALILSGGNATREQLLEVLG